MNKKICAVLFSVIFCLCFIACKKPDSTKLQENSSAQSEQTQSEQTQSEQTQPEQTQPEQTQPEQTQPDQDGDNKTSSKKDAPPQKNSTPQKPQQDNTSSEMTSSEEIKTVKITFPEGTTLPKMFMILDEKKVASQADLFTAEKQIDLTGYPIASKISMTDNRCYRLEGYLFPDTYEFYVGETAESVLKKMLENTQNRLSKLEQDANNIGMSMDDVIILASIIQKETGKIDEMGKVSSVLHNRLEKNMRLQCDPTITYVEGAIKPFIDGDKNRFNASYNTYKCKSLPSGPICNSGISALKAAVNPQKTDYLYFAMDKAGNYYYANTFDEHVENCNSAGINAPQE